MTDERAPAALEDDVLELVCQGCGHEVEPGDGRAEVGLCRRCGVAFLLDVEMARRVG